MHARRSKGSFRCVTSGLPMFDILGGIFPRRVNAGADTELRLTLHGCSLSYTD